MCGLGKHVQSFVERPSSEILLRLWVIVVAPDVDLVTAGSEQRGGKQFSSGAQQARREVDRRGRGEAQLARGRLVGVRTPGLRIGTCNMFRICIRDGRGMSGRVYFLLYTLAFFPFILGIPHTTRTSIPRCGNIDLA